METTFIDRFLVMNGFSALERDPSTFTNGKCNVYIGAHGYIVTWLMDDMSQMYSTDHNIYWLIGVLTYYDLMDKDYKHDT